MADAKYGREITINNSSTSSNGMGSCDALTERTKVEGKGRGFG